MTELTPVRFLQDRINDLATIAADAAAVAGPPWRWAEVASVYKYGLVGNHPNPGHQSVAWVVPSAAPDVYPHRDAARHMEFFDPGWVQLLCETLQMILTQHRPMGDDPNLTYVYPQAALECVTCGYGSTEDWRSAEYPLPYPCGTARTLLALFEKHPDYNPAWLTPASPTGKADE